MQDNPTLAVWINNGFIFSVGQEMQYRVLLSDGVMYKTETSKIKYIEFDDSDEKVVTITFTLDSGFKTSLSIVIPFLERAIIGIEKLSSRPAQVLELRKISGLLNAKIDNEMEIIEALTLYSVLYETNIFGGNLKQYFIDHFSQIWLYYSMLMQGVKCEADEEKTQLILDTILAKKDKIKKRLEFVQKIDF